MFNNCILDLNQQHRVQIGLFGERAGDVLAEASLSAHSVSVTERLVSVTIDHSLQCQFKLSPWKRQKKLSPQMVTAASVYVGLVD